MKKSKSNRPIITYLLKCRDSMRVTMRLYCMYYLLYVCKVLYKALKPYMRPRKGLYYMHRSTTVSLI